MKLNNKFFFIIIFIFTLQFLSIDLLLSDQSIENRKLRWSDFPGIPDNSSEYEAYTYWFVYYKYEAPVFSKNRVLIKFKVWAELGSRSWVKRSAKKLNYSKRLLNHEQGHYDIGRTCARDIKKNLMSYKYTRNGYKREVEKIFNSILNKYQKIEKQYDNKTKHMQNKRAQKEWDLSLKNQLQLLEEYK